MIADSGWLVVGLVFGAVVGFEDVGAAVAAVPVEAEAEMCFVVVVALGQSAKS